MLCANKRSTVKSQKVPSSMSSMWRSLEIGVMLFLISMIYHLGRLRCVVQTATTDNLQATTIQQRTIPLPTVAQLMPSRMTFVTGRFSADGRFAKVVANASKLVKETGFFPEDQIFAYSTFPDFILNATGFEQHLAFLKEPKHESKRGAGFWFWKPLLIQHHLRNMKYGDILVYLDTDEIAHVHFVPTLVRVLNERRANFVTRLIQFRQAEWTKRDIYAKHCPGVNPATDPTLQNEAGRLVIRKTRGTVALFDAWARFVRDYHLISDEPSVKPNVHFFQENRHDQSLFNVAMSCINATRPTELTPLNLCTETANDTYVQKSGVLVGQLKGRFCDFVPYVTYAMV